MGKKKRGHPNVEQLLERPWCYYCERDFEDVKLLISHQKAKHFKCDRCGRRLNTAGGLSVHMNQVHKESLDHVENALPNRQGLDVEIFGVEGIPAEIFEQHRNRIIQNYYQDQENRRIATGNPVAGTGGTAGLQRRKKVVIEPQDQLLGRVAEYREMRRLLRESGGDMSPAAAAAARTQKQQQQQQVPPPAFATQPPQAEDDVDQMIRLASQQQPIVPPPVAAPFAQEAAVAPSADGKKKEKKEKGRMVYDDAAISPEERMALFSRYAVQPQAV